jgi:hypothetical protein
MSGTVCQQNECTSKQSSDCRYQINHSCLYRVTWSKRRRWLRQTYFQLTQNIRLAKNLSSFNIAIEFTSSNITYRIVPSESAMLTVVYDVITLLFYSINYTTIVLCNIHNIISSLYCHSIFSLIMWWLRCVPSVIHCKWGELGKDTTLTVIQCCLLQDSWASARGYDEPADDVKGTTYPLIQNAKPRESSSSAWKVSSFGKRVL